MSTNEAQLGFATTQELIVELAARAEVATTIGETWPRYSTVGEDALTEEPSKPVIREPTETFSVIKARDLMSGTTGLFWTRIRGGWIDDNEGVFRGWMNLEVYEVLRVGIGEPRHLTEEEIDEQQAEAQRILHKLNSVDAGEIVTPDRQEAAYFDEMYRLDAANADNDAYAKGIERAKAVHLLRLRDLRSGAITGERKDAYDKAISAIEEPLP
jgi:hypothetical protein